MPSSKIKKIGIFGGAFDPPHKGHEKALKAFLEAAYPDLMLVIPSGIPPHKRVSGGAEAKDRLQMCRLAFQSLSEKIVVSDEEICAAETTFTYLTVERVLLRYPESEIYLFVGTDQFLSFQTWRKAEYLLEKCTLCVMDRFEGTKAIFAKKEALEKEFGARILLFDEKAYIISSTEIRRELEDKGFSHSLSPEVNALISRKGLYGTCLLQKRYGMIQKLWKEEKEERVLHILSVEREVERLSSLLGYERKKELCFAALWHDCTKHLDTKGQIELLERLGEKPSEDDLSSPAVLHSLTAALLAEREGGFSEKEVSAIRYHTTGRERMTLGEKILFFADYTEETRKYASCREMRNYFYSHLPEGIERRKAFLDECLLKVMEDTVESLKVKKKKIHPMTLRAKEDLKRKENNDIS